MNILEMEGFLRGKCIPRDMLVNETNAQYLIRKFSELERDRDDLQVSYNTVKHEYDSLVDKVNKFIEEDATSTDAELREIGAKAVEDFAKALRKKGDDAFFDAIANAQANAADLFAQQLREGKV
ncbi:hypothetical protein B7L51_019250 [Pectobacterium brasiliense]|uniref:hypothetical protein n=1 Tax=Pectobacterium brasiliense TaxID=180957 RepID=UPI000B96FB1B|nr:hypothetical protein [Pectobacterium carotovorum]OYN49416.1 hypothetical protein B7L51_19285 [Pectobacterium carotovorum]